MLNSSLTKAFSALKSGKIIVYPTDTLYAFGADIFNNKAVRNVFELKKTIRNLRGIGKIEVELHSPFTCWPLNAFANTLEKIKI